MAVPRSFFFSQHDLMRDLAWNLARQDSKRIFIRDNEARHTKEYPNTRKDESSGFQFLSIQTGEMESRDLNRIDFDEVEALALFFTASEYSVPEFIYSMRNLKVVMIHNYSSKRALLHGLNGFLPFTQIKSVLLERLIVPSLYEYCTAWESLEKFCVCLCEDSKKMTLLDKEDLLKFPRIEEINVDHCSELEELPGKICNLTDIKKLSVTNCHLIQELPDDLGKLRSLKLLRLSACLNLSKLPPSIRHLGKLKFLDISQCRGLKCFPSEFDQLSHLETLDMRGCEKLKKLPEGVTKLGSLKHIICDENTKRQWLSIKASAMPKLTVVVVEERFELDWLYN